MGLAEYHRKRDFARTSEPKGKERKKAGWSFCVQKHAATRLHYDFRLELDGVLKSWAVPKGPSFDPADKRLAMQTEDHPVEYGDFEGIIPEGEYGGGTVVLWDRGTWQPLGDPHKDLKAGRLKFTLDGEKLRGAWMLVKIKGRDPRESEKTWLLFKERDAEARPAATLDVTKERPESVKTGRALEEVKQERDRVWHSNKPAARGTAGRLEALAAGLRRTGVAAKVSPRAPRPRPPKRPPAAATAAALPRFVPPALATLVSEAPAGDGWLHEVKLDGYRILCRLEDGRARLLSRNGKDWTQQFPAVAKAAEALPARAALLDGEVAMVLPDGTTSFNAMQNWASHKSATLTYFLFDLLHLDGRDIAPLPLAERKQALAGLIKRARAPLRYSDHVEGRGPEFFAEACRMGLEGIVSKRRDGPYHPGRSRDWLKVKCTREQEFVVGGFTEPEGTRVGLGALVLGVYEGDMLRCVGKVGTGFTDKGARELRTKLDTLEQKECPFTPPPKGMGKPRWVKPELVAEVDFTEWTPDGRLRHPSFQGLREDKPAREIVREVATAPPPAPAAERPARSRQPGRRRSASRSRGEEAEVAGVRLTHADRVLYPRQGLTKLGLARFYESIAEWILPHLRDRPTTLVRCPEGLSEPCFYQKHTGYWAPEEVRRVRIKEKTKTGEYLVVDDLPALIGLVQIGILEVHTWNATVEKLERPDRLVFDLDPGEDVAWPRVIEAAQLLRERLEAVKLASFVKTTGGKGLHVVVPLVPEASWEECAAFARALAETLATEQPRSYLAGMSKAQRQGRIFIDWLRNVRGATSVAAYSTRAKPGAPVSTPLHWDEMEPRIGPEHYTVENLLRRLKALTSDPWQGYDKARGRLTSAAQRVLGREGRRPAARKKPRAR